MLDSRGYTPFAIAPRNSGIIRNKEVFLIPDDAFEDLLNLYTWRGRLKRRLGYTLLGRLRREFTEVSYFDSGASPWSFNVLAISGYVTGINIAGAPTLVVTCAYAHGLSNGDEVVFTGVGGTTQLNGNTYTVANVTSTTFEVTQAGPGAYTSGGYWISNRALSAEPDASLEPGGLTIVVGAETITDNGDGTLTGDVAATGTINYATGAITITGAGAAAATVLTMSYFPGLPVMGLPTREIATINAEDLIAFDTRYAYRWSNTNNAFAEWIPGTIWNGSNSQFFWATNFWRNSSGTGLFWATNYKTSGTIDPIRYTNGSTWTTFNPVLNGTNLLRQAMFMVPYKGRLVCLRNYEGDPAGTTLEYPQRARWCWLGDPTDQTNGWLDTPRAGGGYTDAATSEYIMAVGFVRDLLVVRFEQSTWVLRYSGNEYFPFYWDRVDVEFGSESPFSSINFDKGVLAVADKGITICDGNSVQRVDLDIPDEVYNFHNGNSGAARVHGIRNFEERLVYWTFPNADQNGTYPNRVLVYNYEEGNWAFFSDSFTTYGNHTRFNDVTWGDLVKLSDGNPTNTWAYFNNRAWNAAAIQSGFPDIVAGNQQGFVLTLNQGTLNDESRHITAITVSPDASTPVNITSPDHNFSENEWVLISGVVEASSGNLDVLNGRLYQLKNVDDDTADLFEKPRAAITAIAVNGSDSLKADVTAAGNTFELGDQIEFTQVVGMTEINGLRGRVITEGTTFTVDIDVSGFTAYSSGGSAQDLSKTVTQVNIQTGTYMGAGVLIHQMNIVAKSKKFQMIQQGGRPRLGHIDFLCPVTNSGEFACELYADYADDTPLNTEEGELFNSYVSTAITPFSTQGTSKDWHRFIANICSSMVQYNLTFNDRQLSSFYINEQVVQIDAMVLWMKEGGRLVS